MFASYCAALLLLCGGFSLGKVLEYTCFSYTEVSPVLGMRIINCNSSDVFDPSAGRCVKPAQGHWPCGDVKDCSTLPNHRYVDTTTTNKGEKCKTYYTCQNGFFYGHNYCPGATVFNEKMQYCDWTVNVDPPCGTKGVAPVG